MINYAVIGVYVYTTYLWLDYMRTTHDINKRMNALESKVNDISDDLPSTRPN